MKDRKGRKIVGIAAMLTLAENRALILYAFASDGSSVDPSPTVKRAIRKLDQAAGGDVLRSEIRRSARSMRREGLDSDPQPLADVMSEWLAEERARGWIKIK